MRSAKNKGNRFENYVASQITEMGLGEAHREIGSGSGSRKGDVYSSLPFLLECKNQKALKWWDSIDQARREANQGNYDRDKWALVVRDPREPEFKQVYAMIDFWEFLKLLKKNREPLIKEPDKALKWKLTTLKNAINQVIKDL